MSHAYNMAKQKRRRRPFKHGHQVKRLQHRRRPSFREKLRMALGLEKP